MISISIDLNADFEDRLRRRRISLFRGIFLAVLLLACSANAVHAAPKDPALEAALQAASPQDEIGVIVDFGRRPDLQSLRQLPGPQRRELMVRDLKAAAERDQRRVRSLLQGRGDKSIRDLWMINGLAVKASAEAIQELAARPEVQNVRIDRKIAAADTLLQGLVPEPNVSAINADDLWLQGFFGERAVVALMDTGADVNHPDLANSWRGGTNSWFDPYGQYLEPHDTDGHGTSVLGIMVGGSAGGTSIGTAPGAKWIAAKMFDDDGSTFDSVIHQVFQWFLDPDGNPASDDAPDVVNGSWGFLNLPGICDNTFQPDIDALTAAGIAVVFPAGNSGPGVATSISPANNAGAIAAGFVDANSVIHPVSSRGPSTCDGRIYPDVVAPGVSVKTTDLSFGGGAFYTFGTGSSYSAPHVSGVLALLRSAFPDATLDQLKAALTGSAVDLPANDGPDFDYGYGLIDAQAAFNYLLGLRLGACVRPTIDFSASPYPASPNQPITFSSAVAGGTPAYTYAWDFDSDGNTDCADAVCTHIYPNSYSGSVGLTVTDAAGCSAILFIANGWAACTPISVTFSVSPAAPLTGQDVTYTSSVTGGTPPFVYEWDLDADGLVDCSTATCTKTYSAVFNANVTLRVTDRYGCPSAAYSAAVSVAAAPPPLSSGGGGGGGCFIAALPSEDRDQSYYLSLAVRLVILGIAIVGNRGR